MIIEITYSERYPEAPGMLEELELFTGVAVSGPVVFWPVQVSSELWCLQVASPMMFKGNMPVLAKPFFKWWSPIFPLTFECTTKEEYVQKLIDYVEKILVDGCVVYSSEIANAVQLGIDFDFLVADFPNSDDVADE